MDGEGMKRGGRGGVRRMGKNQNWQGGGGWLGWGRGGRGREEELGKERERVPPTPSHSQRPTVKGGLKTRVWLREGELLGRERLITLLEIG
ncbi:hypothetical protein DVH24_006842 [Malus domestica]|uniref:Uncharacterized protein n=1 Tax=Malus domestica TaxID=3750 RepID=A0A498J871_MALDO|nr:hypothetical protein DVH24_006842 [Malus domestica]